MSGSDTTQVSSREVKIVATAMIGNVLIWFDIAAFGFFSVPISKNFFPRGDDNVALLLTLSSFAVSFVVRPIGALWLGAFADRRGRRSALLVSITLMFLGTFSIAVMPTYDQIGLAAAVGIFVSRVFQGFAAAGEYGAATAYLAELSSKRRGLMASLQSGSQAISGVLAAGFGLLLSLKLTPVEIDTWGWRLPFAFGLLVAPVGLYLRAIMIEATSPLSSGSPARELAAEHKWPTFTALCAIAAATSVGYLLSYLPAYATRSLGLSTTTIYSTILSAFLLQTLIAPFCGHLSDVVGRSKVMGLAALLLLLAVLPAFELLVWFPSPVVFFLTVLFLSLIKSVYAGALPAFMSDLFPRRVRATGVALSYNTGVAMFGGTAPLIMETLQQVTGSKLAPSLYLIATSAIGLWAVTLGARRAAGRTD